MSFSEHDEDLKDCYVSNFPFIQTKIHDGGVVIFCDEKPKNDRNQDWIKDLSYLKAIFEKLNYDVVSLYDAKVDDIIALANLEYKFTNYKSLFCVIFGNKTNDQMKSITDAFEKCATLDGKPKVFFNQLENKNDNETTSSLDNGVSVKIKFNLNIMKYLENECIRLYYRHDLNLFFIQNLSRILNTIDASNRNSWLSFHDIIEMLSDILFHAPDMIKSAPEQEKSKLDLDMIKSSEQMGDKHFSQKEYDEALNYYNKVVDSYLNYQGPVENISLIQNSIIQLYQKIGFVFMQKGNFEEAEVNLKRSLVLCNLKFKDQDGNLIKSDILNSLGTLALLKGNSENGIFYLKQAVEMKRFLHNFVDNFDLAQSLNNLGACYLLKKDIDTAVVYLTEGLEMRKRLLDLKNIKTHEDLANSLNCLGMAYLNRDLKKSEVYTKEGLQMRLALFKDVDNQDLATSLNNYGLVLLLKGDDLEQSDFYLSRGLEMRMRLFKGNKNHPDIIQSTENCQAVKEIKRRRFMIEFMKNAEKQKKTSFCQIL